MNAPYTLFETAWEVCNKVGGIHTVVSTKAKTLVGRFGDEYIAIGPWLLAGARQDDVFEAEAGFEEFCEGCRQLGVPVKVGRWKIPGRPRTILVEFSGLFARKDAILSNLWELHKVDSLFGDWDYVEPVLFGHAAGIVIELWHAEYVLPARRGAVAQFHEWMTGSGLLHLKASAPAIGTVFTTHATILGRSLAAGGVSPAEGLQGRTAEQAATALGIRSKHSIEATCAREADVFTTVSDVTADEAELFFQRRAAPLLPNGIDLDVIDELAGPTTRERAEAQLRDLAARFLGEEVTQSALLCISGRYEFHNKGLDLLLDALARVAEREGRGIVLFVMVPGGNSGLRNEVIERAKAPLEAVLAARPGPVGISTHNLFDFEHDPVHRRCAELGLDNRAGSRVRVIQIPVYFNANDGLLNLPYETLLRAMELSCFPSFYEPWGYTPEESLAVGVPTVTTDCAGFGRWAREHKLGPDNGVFVLARVGVEYKVAAARLADVVDTFVREPRDRDETARVCRNTAQMTAWSGLVECYYQAFERALVESERRAVETAPPRLRTKIALPVVPVPQGQRPHLVPFDVSATLPETLRGLERLTRNFWWSWDPEATALFRELYPAKWESSHHNAVRFLREIYPEDLRQRAAEPAYVARVRRVLARFDAYIAERHREISVPGGTLSTRNPVAYFCAEFGVHESLRIYSGGLGILAGDHLKSASDLGLPLVGVGLFYKKGYIQQRISSTGEQTGTDFDNEPHHMPLELVLDEQDRPLEITLQLPSSNLVLRAWKVAVGRVPLYLLDADVPANRPEDRDITRHLYGGDHEHRLRQEIVLGRGGARFLERLGIEPAVWHINEGHAAFLALERVGRLIREHGLTFDEAREIVRSTTVFTTHTPVPAGHDRFGEDLIRRYFSDAPAWVGVPWERFYALGQAEDDRGAFNMTYLALHFAAFANGVSALHGKVSRRLLHSFWPKLLESEVPVTSITNGVHLATWTDPDLRRLLGVDERPIRGEDVSKSAPGLDARAFGEIKRAGKRRLVAHVRESLEKSFVERHDSPTVLHRMLAGLDEDCLWIGFARRFAPYKRAQLLFRDPKRLKRILDDADRPVRIVFAGKAHPNDRYGQDILRSVVLATRSEDFVGRVFFLEDYDLDLARRLVQGVDVWLNTPVRPLEASGTSGMKVAANGGLNLSVPDGWWIEAVDSSKGGSNGWSIGGGRVFPNQELQDELDAENLYRLLEDEIVPLYYERASGEALGAGWIARALRSLATIPRLFNTDRMVSDYRDRAYLPLAAQFFALSAERCQPARALNALHTRIRKGFADVKILGAHIADLTGIRVGDAVEVRVGVDLGSLSSEDVAVELVLGHANAVQDLHNMHVITLEPAVASGESAHVFEGRHRVERSGSFAYGIRVRARDEALCDLVLWA